MKKVLILAKRGRGTTSPNPMVGAIVEKNNTIIAGGYHQKAGKPHAEVIALDRAGSIAKGSTLYVNLEPCCHYGKTPPCTQTIIKSGVKRVVIGMKDPNHLVSGQGILALKNAGISVSVGVLQDQAMKLNEVFCKYITKGLPFVTLKAAVTLDGKIATHRGNSRWITGETARKFVHKLRFYHDAVMVGIGTILQDDPLLTCRLSGKKRKIVTRIIVDSRGRIPLKARVLGVQVPGAKEQETEMLQGPEVQTGQEKILENKTGTIVVVTEIPDKKRLALEKKGIEVLVTRSRDGKVDIHHLFHTLGKKGVSSVLVEGGGTINASVIENRMADKLLLFLAPKIIGGENAPTFVQGRGKAEMNEAVPLYFSQKKRFGDDLMLEYYFYTHDCQE